MKIQECCYDCGEKRYRTRIKNNITVTEGICPFCKEKKLLVPIADWIGCGD